MRKTISGLETHLDQSKDIFTTVFRSPSKALLEKHFKDEFAIYLWKKYIKTKEFKETMKHLEKVEGKEVMRVFKETDIKKYGLIDE